MRTWASPPSVHSTGTTQSAPGGIGAPVMIRAVRPGWTLMTDDEPAAMSPTTGSDTGVSGDASATSTERTAYPSIDELSKRGSADPAVTAWPRTQPCASRSGSSISPSGWTVSRTWRRCSSTVLTGFGSSGGDVLLEPREELRAEVGALDGELYDGAQVLGPVSGVEAAAREHDPVHG